MRRIPSRQILEIRMLNDSKLKYFDELPDTHLVQLLKDADNDAWAYVFVRVVRAVVCGSTKNGVSYRRILKDKYLEERDVWSDLYAEMIGRNKLELYKFGCPVVNWMRIYVVNIILGYCKKFPSHVSDECLKYISISKAAIRESAEVNQVSFAELWRENPMRAYVFLLKSQDYYSSEEIKNYLGLSSSNNVDQYYARARKDMAELVKKFSGDAK